VTTAAMRWMLLVAGAFVVIADTQLFVLTEHTERYVAWSVDQPLTAAFLGAGYWASAVLELGSACHDESARLAMPAVLLFTTITLAVTLIHLSRVHLHGLFGIACLVVYASFPAGHDSDPSSTNSASPAGARPGASCCRPSLGRS
jgi:hypothetical protein